MSKKKVTVPRTYNPGKGRPKEYLAYLNWQEMQELQRINGGNMERGPKGLPSFPPAGAMSGGSAKSPASTSTSKAAGSTASKSATSGKMGASSSQTGGVRSTSTAKSTSTASKSTTSGKMGASSSQTGGVRSATGGGGGGGGSGTSGRIGSAVTGARVGTSNLGISRGVSGGGGGGGGGGVSRPAVTGGAGRDSTRGLGVGAGTTAIGRSDKSAISAANKANARSAENTPALKNDRARSTGPGGGVLQAPVRETSPGQRISGAIRSVQQPVSTATRSVGAPAATMQIGSTPMSTQGISFGTPAAARAFNMAVSGRTAAGVPASGSFPSPAQIRAETQARLNAQRMAQQPVDFTGANSPFADPSVVSYTRPGITDYPSAPQGVYGPRTGVGIGYLSPAVTPGMITTGMPSPYSGTIQPRYNAEATLKAYEAEKRAPVQAKIQDRVPTATPTTPQGRVAVPGLITNPSLSRPMTSEDAFRQYAEMRNPTAIPISQPLPTPKPIQDRLNVVPSWEQSAYTGVGQFDVPVDGKIQDRINVVPSPEQSLYTGRPPQRISEAPPYAGAERVLRVENIMSDAGIRKSIPGGISTIPSDIFEGANSPFASPEVESYTPGFAPARPVTGPWPGQSAIPPNPPVYTPGKVFTDPIADRVLGTYPGPISSPVSITPGGMTVYRTPEGFGIAEPPAPMRASDMPPYAGTGITALAPQAPAPGLSRVSNIFATNPRTLATDLRQQITEGYEGLRPRGEDTAVGVPGPETPRSDVVEGAPREGEVTVKRGDTLTKIARENGVTIDSILDANPQITNPDRIREGQRISIPGGGDQDAEGASPSQQIGAPSQDISISEEAEIAQENYRKKADIARRVGTTALNLTAPGAGTLFGQGLKYLNEGTQKLVDAYQDAGMAERKEMEEAFPNLIAHGNAMGINTYYGMDKYNSWADERGLRAPQSSGGGGGRESGIGALAGIDYPYGSSAAGGSSSRDSDSTPSTPTGARPYIYYEWDLGLNIPSPSDPKYTDYQKYLAERAAAQASFGMV